LCGERDEEDRHPHARPTADPAVTGPAPKPPYRTAPSERVPRRVCISNESETRENEFGSIRAHVAQSPAASGSSCVREVPWGSAPVVRRPALPARVTPDPLAGRQTCAKPAHRPAEVTPRTMVGGAACSARNSCPPSTLDSFTPRKKGSTRRKERTSEERAVAPLDSFAQFRNPSEQSIL